MHCDKNSNYFFVKIFRFNFFISERRSRYVFDHEGWNSINIHDKSILYLGLIIGIEYSLEKLFPRNSVTPKKSNPPSYNDCLCNGFVTMAEASFDLTSVAAFSIELISELAFFYLVNQDYNF